ncbi:MAG: hypothetical protein K0S74_840 [Chlamydiales bacterium]|jgi:hypothetical protein|nr:hypothetical protein [Chlamydiales bacterium]
MNPILLESFLQNNWRYFELTGSSAYFLLDARNNFLAKIGEQIFTNLHTRVDEKLTLKEVIYG